MNTPKDMSQDFKKIRKPLLLYFYLSDSSFVIQDITTLRIDYRVKLFRFHIRHKFLVPLSFLEQKLFLLANISFSSILMCQFAGYHSFLPVIFGRLFHKPCAVVVGGTDCTSMPSISYGNLRKPLLGWFTRKSLKHAAHIITPGISLVECDYTYTDKDYPKQGFRYFDKSIVTPFTVIFNGVDTSHFSANQRTSRKKDSFLTICSNIDRRNFRLKGIDLFIAAAGHFPEYDFTIIGKSAPGFYIDKPDNVTFRDYVPHELLPARMAGYAFYCQLSMSEGFGLALAEAMACGCVPIVSKVGILDFIAGDSGFVLEKRDNDMLFALIEKAVNSYSDASSIRARSRIVGNFQAHRRRSELLTLLNNLRS
jgi:glycosyltransferase involved in cell wall biosynthesis